MFWNFSHEACRILALWPGIEPLSPAIGGEVLTAGPPGKSQKILKSRISLKTIILPSKGMLVLVAQLCPTVCNPMDCIPPGSSVHGIQARILEWVVISFSRGSSWLRDWTPISGSCSGRQILYHWSNWQAPQPTVAAAAAAKSLQSCLTLCDAIDSSPPGSPIPGILQARALEWVAITFSSAWKWKMKVKLLGGVWLFATPWTAAYQAPPSMGFSRQEDWSGLGSSK